jgi:hypothetical protein
MGENKDSRNLFHTPCITPRDMEIPRWHIFDKSRWSPGPLGSYHFYCDLYSSEPDILHHEVCGKEALAKGLGESRTAYKIVTKAEKQLRRQAPFLRLLLSCRRM